MADTKISAEPAASALTGTELLAGVQSAANVNITPAQIKTYVYGATTGSNTQVLFNDSGVLAGDAGLTYNKTTDALTVAGALNSGAHVAAGHLTFSPDNTYDIGASGATRPRTAYFGTSINVNGAVIDNYDLMFNRAGTVYVSNGNAGGSLKIGVTGAVNGINIDSSANVQFAGNISYTGSTNAGYEIVKTRVVTGAGAVTVSATTDYIVVVNKSSGAATTVNLPSSPTAGLTFVIKDGKGDAATNNITLTPAAGTIDGQATIVMATNYESQTLVYNGTEWNLI